MYDELDFSTSTGVVPDENINAVTDLILKYYDMPRDQALSIAKPSGFIKLSSWDEKIKPKGDEKLFRTEFAITRIVEAYGQEITRKDIQHLVFLLKSFELGPQCLEGIYYELLDHGPFSSYVAATIDSAVTLGLLNEDHIGSNWYYTPTNMHNSKEFNQYKPLSNLTIGTIQYLKKYDLCLVSSVRFFQCENEGELDEDIIQYLDYNLGFGDSGYEYLRFSKEVLRDVKYEIT
jgi:hypothetical protein